MATLTQAFHKESEKVQHQHYILKEELHALELALEHLTANLNHPANLIAAKQIQMYARQLADELPLHFQHEEHTILTTVAEISPELDFFAREMKHQHEDLRVSLASFCAAIDALGTSDDLPATVETVRAEGKAFVHQLKEHIAIEERELSGFL
jgi:hemerythrin-like domain-containing protein